MLLIRNKVKKDDSGKKMTMKIPENILALEDEIIEELDLPGWTDQLVGELTDIYEEDVLDISRMPGVQLISP